MTKTSKCIVIATILSFIINISFPVFAITNPAVNQTQSIMLFDNTHSENEIFRSIENKSPDFFIIHGYCNKDDQKPNKIQEEYYTVPLVDLKNDDNRATIFYKKHYDIIRSKTFWLSGTPNKRSNIKTSQNFQNCTYALFCNKENNQNIAIFAAEIDCEEISGSKQASYLFSRFQCYRDYFPTIVSIKCENNENSEIFCDHELSQNIYSQNCINVYSSKSVNPIESNDNLISFTTTKCEKQLNTNGKFIALTFDDGPTRLSGRTDKILSIIQKYNIKATFFVLGSRLTQDNPSERKLLLRARCLGCEIGNHTFSHDSYAKLGSNANIQQQIDETDKLIYEICGGNYATLLRPPGGIVNNKPDLDRPIINWSIDTNDWSSKQTTKGIVNTIKKEAATGKIVLMHDINTKSSSCFEEIVIYLKNNGYNIVSVSELMEFCDVDLWSGYIYTDANHEKRTTFCN